MKCTEDDCKQLAMGMMFHDCGQMFLPKEVFDKPGKLAITPSKPVGTAADLSVAYSPGVAEPCTR